MILLLLATASQMHGQGFVYDQQSATTPEKANFDSFDIYKLLLLQAFVPTVSSIGFVQLQLWDYLDSNTNGARIGVSLYSGTPSNPTLIGSTALVYLPPDFNNNQLTLTGVTNFYFAAPVALTPGQTYYLSPDEVTGDHSWAVVVTTNTYPNGQLYGGGNPFTPTTDLWFREGIVTVPEPSNLALCELGGVLIAWISGFKRRIHQQPKKTK